MCLGPVDEQTHLSVVVSTLVWDRDGGLSPGSSYCSAVLDHECSNGSQYPPQLGKGNRRAVSWPTSDQNGTPAMLKLQAQGVHHITLVGAARRLRHLRGALGRCH